MANNETTEDSVSLHLAGPGSKCILEERGSGRGFHSQILEQATSCQLAPMCPASHLLQQTLLKTCSTLENSFYDLIYS